MNSVTKGLNIIFLVLALFVFTFGILEHKFFIALVGALYTVIFATIHYRLKEVECQEEK